MKWLAYHEYMATWAMLGLMTLPYVLALLKKI